MHRLNRPGDLLAHPRWGVVYVVILAKGTHTGFVRFATTGPDRHLMEPI